MVSLSPDPLPLTPLPGTLLQGHHGGLQSKSDFKGWLDERKVDPATEGAVRLAREAIEGLVPATAVPTPKHVEADRKSAELFLRLLFSTQSAISIPNGRRCENRPCRSKSSGIASSPTRRVSRAQVAAASLVPAMRYTRPASRRPPASRASFALRSPRGGGKTRSAMGFALRHALLHGMERIVVAVPLITVTEQTTSVYRLVDVVRIGREDGSLAARQAGRSCRAPGFARSPYERQLEPSHPA